MMEFFLPAIFLVLGGISASVWYRRRREQLSAMRRRVEAAEARYTSLGVKALEDLERWKKIDFAALHPLNRDEVIRLLEIVVADGTGVLSTKERLFLDNMTLPRLGS